jgi:L-amino acid N-acyltransferase YncA
MSDFDIRAMRSEDWPAIQNIYSEGIATGNATFEIETSEWTEWDKRHLKECRLVARDGEQIIGWIALSPVSSRRVYAGVAEVSVYVAAEVQGRGVGTLLMQSLVEQSERCGIWTLQAGIFPENAASVALVLRISRSRASTKNWPTRRYLAGRSTSRTPELTRRPLSRSGRN